MYVCNIILETVGSALETLLVVVAALVWMDRVTFFPFGGLHLLLLISLLLTITRYLCVSMPPINVK